MCVAIDGPAGSGKSTTARLVAQSLGLQHVDTGAMYRSVALLALRNGVDLENGARLEELARAADIGFEKSPGGAAQKVLLDGQDVTEDIRTPEVTAAVSPVSAHAGVRRAMVRAQRRLAALGGCVVEGRDVGTVVLPGADVKIYLVASTRVRAERRLEEFRGRGVSMSLEEVESDIIRRDEYDSLRKHSPLRKAVGAVEVDTSGLTIEEQVALVVDTTRKTAEKLHQLQAGIGPKSSARKIRFVYRVSQGLALLVMRMLFRLRVSRELKYEYEENYIYACNHIAYADPPFVGSTFSREVHFLAKESLFSNRLFGVLIRFYNAIPLRRGVFDREAMDLALKLLTKGRSLMIFPEGGRMRKGNLGEAKSGVGFLAVNSGVPVVPVYVAGTNRLWRCLTGRARLTVKHGRPIRLGDVDLDGIKNKESYRSYGDMVMSAIAALKEETDGG